MRNLELKNRIYSSIIYVSIILFMIGISVHAALALFAFICLLAVYEFLKVTNSEGSGLTLYPLYLLIILSSFWTVLFISHVSSWLQSHLSDTCLMSAILLLIWCGFVFSAKDRFNGTARLYGLFAHILIPLLVATISIQYLLPEKRIVMLSIFAIIWFNDTGAYFIGKRYGKKKLFPMVSPNKTWEGFLGGLLFSILMAIILSFFINHLSLTNFVILALIISICSPAGDILESKIKRIYEVKDSGKFMPGHGGLLDRIDGFLFCIPFCVLFLTYIIR